MANVARFFYFYDITGEHRRPVVTVCRLRSDERTYGYGWAVCSDSDSPCKRTGRAIAEGRARAAFLSSMSHVFSVRSHMAKIFVHAASPAALS